MNTDFKSLYPFWNSISDEQKELIKSSVMYFSFSTGDVVKLKDVTKKNGLLIIMSGFLRLYLSENGREITISEIKKGEGFCILTIDDATKNDAMPDLQAREDTVIAYLSISVMEKLSRENRAVGEYMFKTAISSAQNILNSVSHHFFNSIRSCLAKFLVDNANYSGSDLGSIRITHEQLAKNLGTSRVVVSRELEYFGELGLIKTGRGKIDIYNIDELKTFAGY